MTTVAGEATTTASEAAVRAAARRATSTGLARTRAAVCGSVPAHNRELQRRGADAASSVVTRVGEGGADGTQRARFGEDRAQPRVERRARLSASASRCARGFVGGALLVALRRRLARSVLSAPSRARAASRRGGRRASTPKPGRPCSYARVS